ncbi:hypothetical protein [Parasitella parasitica]|uniref:Cyclin N-terminal domain-containing protein n=1 Tax=Parasitella parasitica TaxID=35722 RepID=A0A0B7MTH3_9FUNG|nr:hypothetical protein [Parasitella parasitica]
MKALANKHNAKHRHLPCPYRRQQLESNNPEKLDQPRLFGHHQACALLQAIELNGRKRLSKKCLGELSVFVSRAWEDKPCQEKIQQLYYMMNNLLDTTGMDKNEPFEVSLQKFCSSPVSTPIICPSLTLLIAISYVERLNKRYRDLKGTPGCGSRMIMIAYIMASRYIHDSLRLIIYTNVRKHASIITTPITPPSSPKMFITSSIIENITIALNNHTSTSSSSDENNSQKVPITSDDSTNSQKNESSTTATNPIPEVTDEDRNLRIARMEQEFLFFLNYDLSVQDPSLLVKWAQSYESPEDKNESKEAYTSADEGDDEMDDDEEK